MSQKRKIARIDSEDIDLTSSASVSTTPSDVQVRNQNDYCIDLRYYRRAEEDRKKLAQLVKRKSSGSSILQLYTPDCSAVDCPYSRLCLTHQRFKLMQMLQMINTFLWGKLSEILQIEAQSCLTVDCTASDCPYCADGSLLHRRFKCMQRLHQINCTLWGEDKAIHMDIDIRFDHDILWSPAC